MRIYWGGAEQGKYENREAFATIQVAGDGGLDQGVSSGGGEKWSDFGWIVKVVLSRLFFLKLDWGEIFLKAFSLETQKTDKFDLVLHLMFWKVLFFNMYSFFGGRQKLL